MTSFSPPVLAAASFDFELGHLFLAVITAFQFAAAFDHVGCPAFGFQCALNASAEEVLMLYDFAASARVAGRSCETLGVRHLLEWRNYPRSHAL